MSNLVIVAIPDENDRVWKISSEKVPHCTLLFLGEVEDVQNVTKIQEFVGHAASTTLKRFYLPVDRRGELGDDKADVLFFKKSRYDFKGLQAFRAALLQNTNIKTAHDSVEQFEGWTPHLTLGYPDSPAKPDPTDRDFGFYDVAFDRIAVWIDDYDGPEFILKDYWDEFEDLHDGDSYLCYGEERVPEQELEHEAALGFARSCNALDGEEEFLEHYGVKGMKWGVRRYGPTAAGVAVGAAGAAAVATSGGFVANAAYRAGATIAVGKLDARAAAKAGKRPGPEDRLPTAKDAARAGKSAVKRLGKGINNLSIAMAESSWQNSTYSVAKHEEVHNHAAAQVDKGIYKLASSPKYRDKNLKADSNLRKSYYEDVAKVTDSAYRRAVKDVYGENYSGTKTVRYVDDARGARIEIRDKRTKEWLAEAPFTSKREIARINAEQEKRIRDAYDARHAAVMTEEDFPELEIQVAIDDNGQISGVGFVDMGDDELEQANPVGEFLEHFGIKGMKWGVTRTNAQLERAAKLHSEANALDAQAASAGGAVRARVLKENAKNKRYEAGQLEKAANKRQDKHDKKVDAKWEKNIYSVPGAVAVHNASAEHFNSRIGALNDKYKDHDFSKEAFGNPAKWSEPYRKYMGEANDLQSASIAAGVTKVHGTSPSGKKKAELEMLPNGEFARIKVVKVETKPKIKHADEDEETTDLEFLVKMERGLLVEMNQAEMADSMAQTTELGEAFLEHHGIKGMKWGVTRTHAQLAQASKLRAEGDHMHRQAASAKGATRARVLKEGGDAKHTEAARLEKVANARLAEHKVNAPVTVHPTAASVVPKGDKRKTQIKTHGGENHEAHTDALKVAEAKAKLKKSGPAALSNKELADVARRVQLENQVKQLTQPKGKQFIANLLKNQGNQAVNRKVQDTVNPKKDNKKK